MATDRANAGARIEVIAPEQIGFVSEQNSVPPLRQIIVHNDGDQPLANLTLSLSADPAFLRPRTWHLDRIDGCGEIRLTDLKVDIAAERMGELTESEHGTVTLTLSDEEGEELAATPAPMTILAKDQWGGSQAMPELLAAFAMPNDPAVDKLLKAACEALRRQGKPDKLDGYKSGSSARCYELVSAIWSAVAGLSLSYALPPAEFERTGQKVRSPSAIMGGGLATCLDSALLLAAMIEQAGLNPVIALTHGHAFAGAWMTPRQFGEIMIEDASLVRNHVELKELILFETTLVTGASPATFSQGIAEAKRQLDELERGDRFLIVDVRRARMQQITPLSQRLAADPEADNLEAGKIAVGVETAPEGFDVDFDAPERDASDDKSSGDRITDWQRKLLDLSARNRLLNLPRSGHVKLVCPDPGAVEDRLAEGATFRVKPMPDLAIGGRDPDLHRSRSRKDLASQTAAAGLDKDDLFVDMPAQKLENQLVKLYRTARTDLAEGGANTLFLAFGFLEWRKDEKDQKAYRAPLILLPVSMKRKSVRSGMTLSSHADDARFNLTLLELLRQDFDIDIQGLDGDLPTDDSGVDIDGIWNRIRREIRGIPGFEVRDDVVLGVFSFSKYLMWKDLVDRRDKLTENRVVKHMVEGGADKFETEGEWVEPERLDAEIDPAELFAPLPADSSQLAAIWGSGNGRDFVLDGPPGTGKSQTIANMIAHNLALGRRVLFVSEKRAALDVVYRRLEVAGLGEFCLELHSRKSTKTEVLRQLEEAWDTRGSAAPKEWQTETQRLSRLRDELNRFVTALHQAHPNGLSVFGAIAAVTAHGDGPIPRLTWSIDTEHSAGDYEAMRAAVRELALRYRDIDEVPALLRDYVEHKNFSNAWQSQLVGAAQALGTASDRLQSATRDALGSLSVELPMASPADAAVLSELVAALLATHGRDLAFAFKPSGSATIGKLSALARHIEAWREHRGRLGTAYAEPAEAEAAAPALAEDWSGAGDKFWFLETLARRRVAKALQTAGETAERPDPADDLPVLAAMSAERTAAAAILADLPPIGGLSGFDSDPAIVAGLADAARTLRAAIAKCAPTSSEHIALTGAARSLVIDANDLLAPDGRLAVAHTQLSEKLSGFEDTEAAFRELSCADLPTAFTDVAALTDAVATHRAKLKAVSQWNEARRAAEVLGLKPLIDPVKGGLSEEDAVALFETAYAKWWGDIAIDADPLLTGFHSASHESLVARYREAVSATQDLTAGIVRARLCSDLPAKDGVARKSGYGILKHELGKQRAHKAVRQLAEEMGSDFTALAPCMMMSPLSIAQYLPPDQDLFDIVIFDEASQITPWDAIGSIARGRQLVVAGDPKQMPPTSFFSRGSAGAGDDADIEDLESILDECTNIIPQESLTWHYRSRHDSLIAFSNSRYYRNSLTAFPAPETRSSAVSWRKVDAVYGKGAAQTNAGEAKAIIAEVKERLSGKTPKDTGSLGIVTLNSKQQELIENLLESARRSDPSLEEHFSDDLEEPVLVKNLETVQGDERDHIILGVTFGPTEPGAQKMSMNFGPLNREGGWRRLNVAVTRARQSFTIFTSFNPGMIDLNRTSAEAVRDLKTFIEFADRGPRVLGTENSGSLGPTESPFEDAVKAMLERRGWQVRPQIGISGYRIDLGIVHPDLPGVYLAGVECDGAMYHSAKTARDRDKVRQAVLENLGWTILRLWSTDFWTDRKGAIDRLHSQLEDQLERDRSERDERRSAEANRTESGAAGPDGCEAPDPASLPADAAGSGKQGPPAEARPNREASSEAVFARAAASPSTGAGATQADDDGPSSEPTTEPYRRTDFAPLAAMISGERLFDDDYREVLRRLVLVIAGTEAPIEEGALISAIARAHGFKRAGRRIRERVQAALTMAAHRQTEADGTVMVWRDAGHPARLSAIRLPEAGDEARPIAEIALAELRLAAGHESDAEDIPVAVARRFGIRRLGRAARERIEMAMT
ncbi:MAG: DUF3320 domain-containing protein [Pacificimonas sp.]|nr:DUF3320 domain-containing protein [Pacificimonas sp.]